MSKLTLSVDAEVVERAKRYAKQRGVSISAIVESYLASVSGDVVETKTPPVLRSLRGSLKNASLPDYRKHIVEKYR